MKGHHIYSEREIKGLCELPKLENPLYEVCLVRIKEQVDEKRSTDVTHRNADCLLKNTSINSKKRLWNISRRVPAEDLFIAKYIEKSKCEQSRGNEKWKKEKNYLKFGKYEMVKLLEKQAVEDDRDSIKDQLLDYLVWLKSMVWSSLLCVIFYRTHPKIWGIFIAAQTDWNHWRYKLCCKRC